MSSARVCVPLENVGINSTELSSTIDRLQFANGCLRCHLKFQSCGANMSKRPREYFVSLRGPLGARWRSRCGQLVAGRMRVRAGRVCPPLIDMLLSKQLRPRSARSSRRKCSSAASSSPGRSPTNPTASSRNMKSNTTRK